MARMLPDPLNMHYAALCLYLLHRCNVVSCLYTWSIVQAHAYTRAGNEPLLCMLL